MSGVGKTTVARKLCDKLNELGRRTDCYLEFDFRNPVDFYCTAYLGQTEYAALLTEYSKFSEDIKCNTISADDIRLFDIITVKLLCFPDRCLIYFANANFATTRLMLSPYLNTPVFINLFGNSSHKN